MSTDRRAPISDESLDALEARVGYVFRDRRILVRALTHSSYSNETGERNHHLLCNERLEFLGDSVLSIVVSEYLFTTYRHLPEGDLTNKRKDVVCADALARYARAIGLGDCLLLGIGEERSGGREKVNILADAFEALLAAVYLDAGQEGDAKEIISRFLIPFVAEDLHDLDARGIDGDYKTLLQQFVQKQDDGSLLEYVIIREDGPDHNKTFEVEARLNSNVIGHGVGHKKKEAEQAAARDAWQLFGLEE